MPVLCWKEKVSLCISLKFRKMNIGVPTLCFGRCSSRLQRAPGRCRRSFDCSRACRPKASFRRGSKPSGSRCVESPCCRRSPRDRHGPQLLISVPEHDFSVYPHSIDEGTIRRNVGTHTLSKTLIDESTASRHVSMKIGSEVPERRAYLRRYSK